MNILVRIDWLDHRSVGDDWEAVGTVAAMRPLLVHSVGWLLFEDENCVTLVPTWYAIAGEEDTTHGSICIVKQCIVTREKLKETKNE
jgi:hypothetical protein